MTAYGQPPLGVGQLTSDCPLDFLLDFLMDFLMGMQIRILFLAADGHTQGLVARLAFRAGAGIGTAELE